MPPPRCPLPDASSQMPLPNCVFPDAFSQMLPPRCLAGASSQMPPPRCLLPDASSQMHPSRQQANMLFRVSCWCHETKQSLFDTEPGNFSENPYFCETKITCSCRCVPLLISCQLCLHSVVGFRTCSVFLRKNRSCIDVSTLFVSSQCAECPGGRTRK